MTTNTATQKAVSNSKPKKRNKLRHLEYYDFQDELDNLYNKSEKVCTDRKSVV